MRNFIPIDLINMLKSRVNIVGALGKLPQNMSQYHINYFELKWHKKHPMQAGHFDPDRSLPES